MHGLNTIVRLNAGQQRRVDALIAKTRQDQENQRLHDQKIEEAIKRGEIKR